MKKCSGCGVEKPYHEFYAHPHTADKRMAKCKKCHRLYVKENRQKNGDYYKAYDKQRANDPKRVQARCEYAKSDQGRKRQSAAIKAWQKRNPQKRHAHIALGNAVRDGRIIKPSKCEECEMQKRLQGHHDDYAKPLDVKWLCINCHRKRHAWQR